MKAFLKQIVKVVKKDDPELAKLIEQEILRQEKTINLIPSENVVPLSMLGAIATPLMNKYSEGYPEKRYYPGNVYNDQIELLAQKRAKKLFNLKDDWGVNVQSYSGSPANMAVYFGLLKPGETVMGMNLAAGGHLTHGHKVNFSGKFYNSVQYGVNEKTGLIDYDALEKLAMKYKPRLIISGYTAYPRKIDFKKINQIAKKVGAYHLADISHIAGLVAAGVHPSPFKDSDVVMMTTHKTLRGPRGAVIFAKAELMAQIDKAVFPGLQGGPHNNITAAKALAFYLDKKPGFTSYSKQIIKNAKTLADELKKNGFTLLTGGTDNHLMLIDLRPLGLEGKEAEKILENAGILANRNSLPADLKPFNPSGIRLGTPAITSRGFKEKEMKQIATWFKQLLIEKQNPGKIEKEVIRLCKKFPLPY
ncbi:MAG: serine hydroxymethyltransferase [Minisyncoccia bacterium]